MKTEEQKPDNQKAFPNDWNINDGMTLRDYFAAKAMQAMISNPDIVRPGEQEKDFVLFSERSYRYSDAMLKQREL